MCLIIAAAKLVATSQPYPTLSDRDRTSLRVLAEELFRESICTEKWSGSGDSKLREWLDRYFFASSRERSTATPGSLSTVSFPGDRKTISSSYDKGEQWRKFLETVRPVDVRAVPKEWQYFHFILQYLYDCKVHGCLPKGAVGFDHIVPFNKGEPLTSHPYNFAAISHDLNLKKGGNSFANWAPSGLDRANYELQVLNNQIVRVGSKSIGPLDLLANANMATLSNMIQQREQLIRFAFEELLPQWTSDGDR